MGENPRIQSVGYEMPIMYLRGNDKSVFVYTNLPEFHGT